MTISDLLYVAMAMLGTIGLSWWAMTLLFHFVKLTVYLRRPDPDAQLESATPPPYKKPRFAILIPARNEQAVVSDLIHSLLKIDYPKDKYQIFVVADNCTDDTAEVARQTGVTVFERNDSNHQTKGHAMAWLAKRIEPIWSWDACVIFDADNIVTPNFLNIMADRLERGKAVIQGNLRIKNVNDSWASRMMRIMFAMWEVEMISRALLGVSVQLHGTGCCFRRDVFYDHFLGSVSLTEDLESQVRIELAGLTVNKAEQAVFYDENISGWSQYYNQRARFTSAKLFLLKRYGLRLLAAGIRHRRLGPLLAFFRCMGSTAAIKAAIACALGVLALLMGPGWLTAYSILVVAQAIHVLAIFYARSIPLKELILFIGIPFYLTLCLMIFMRYTFFPNHRWRKTAHNAAYQQ